MIKTIEIAPDIFAKTLAEHLAIDPQDFIEMEWSGNPYTGEGNEYPIINEERLAKRIREYCNK